MDGAKPDRGRGRGPKPGSAEWWARRAPGTEDTGGPDFALIVVALFVVATIASGGLFLYQSFVVQPAAAMDIPPTGGAGTVPAELKAATTYSIALDTSGRDCFGCSLSVTMALTPHSETEPVWSDTREVETETDSDSTTYYLDTYVPPVSGTYNLSYAAAAGRGSGDWTLTLSLRPVLVAPEIVFAALFLSIFGGVGSWVLLSWTRKRRSA